MKISRFSLLLSAVAALVLVQGCRLKDIRTVTLHARGVRCPVCASAVIRSLATTAELSPDQAVTVDESAQTATATWKAPARNNTAAVSKVVVRYGDGEIDVTYDSMKLAIKNLEFAVAQAGYDVQAQPCDIAADPAARAALPETCRSH